MSRCLNLLPAESLLIARKRVLNSSAGPLGFKLEASPLEIASVLGKAARSEMDYAGVRAWVADRLLPFGG